MATHGGMQPVSHDDRGPSVVAIIWVFTSLALITVLLRLATRIKFVSWAGRDDATIGASMIFGITYSILCTVAVANYTGKHMVDIPLSEMTNAIKLNAISMPPGIMAFCFPKLAIIFLIVRTFEPPKWQRWTLYVLWTMLLIVSSLNGIFIFVQCSPASGLWDQSLNPVCWEPSILVGYSIFTGSFSAFMDILLGLYPATRIWRLNMPRQKKITVGVLMGLGAFAGIIAIVKCTKLPSLGNHSEYLYATADLLYWTSIESNSLIIAASIPTLGPLVRLIRGRSQGSSKPRSNGDYHFTANRNSGAPFGSRRSDYYRQGSDATLDDPRLYETMSDEKDMQIYKGTTVVLEHRREEQPGTRRDLESGSGSSEASELSQSSSRDDALKLVPDGVGRTQYGIAQ